MTTESVIYEAMKNDGTVYGLVGDRIYPDLIPAAAALPCIGFSRTGTEYLNTIHGVSVGGRVSLDVWAMDTSREGADALASAIVTAISGSGFVPTNRRAETEGESSDSFEVTVLAVDYWE